MTIDFNFMLAADRRVRVSCPCTELTSDAEWHITEKLRELLTPEMLERLSNRPGTVSTGILCRVQDPRTPPELVIEHDTPVPLPYLETVHDEHGVQLMTVPERLVQLLEEQAELNDAINKLREREKP